MPKISRNKLNNVLFIVGLGALIFASSGFSVSGFAMAQNKSVDNKTQTSVAESAPANAHQNSIKKCVVTGCSNTICTSEEELAEKPMASICLWKTEYACYGSVGKCEQQADGNCGWTESPELETCLESKTRKSK